MLQTRISSNPAHGFGDANLSSDPRQSGQGSHSRIPCLDGLRAISIIGVFSTHLTGTRGFPTWSWWEFGGDLGNLGVRCFFVISGFLITHLLLQELRATGCISLKNFYIRRTFRIFPAFYTFIGCVFLFSMVGLVVVKPADLGYAATYSIDFIQKKSWVVAHIWSLSVEEQFYLLWPLCMVTAGLKRAKGIALSIIVLVPFLRIAVWYCLPQYQDLITKAFPTVCDTIATGCVLACFREWLWGQPRYRAFLGSAWFALVPFVVLISNAFASHTRPDLLCGQTVRNIGIALCLDWCMRYSGSPIGKCLNAPLMVWFGTLSYSLYLWQQLFLNRNSDRLFCHFPLNIVAAFLFASLSYYLVERRFLKMRGRVFAPRLVLKESSLLVDEAHS